MIGIYKITNINNGLSYIGQSVNIERRWKEHCQKSHSSKSLIAKAITEEGQENFTFEVLMECSIEELDINELKYINLYNTITPNGYNSINWVHSSRITRGYSEETIREIISELKEDILSLGQIAEKYNIHVSTISRINSGHVHRIENEKYPIKEIYSEKNKLKTHCKKCGKIITNTAIFCQECYREEKRKNFPKREILKQLIREKPFLQIGKDYEVSDNAIRKWCDYYNLPRKKKDINSYSDEEWDLI